MRVDAATLHAFEYSHIFVFSFAIVYVIQSAVLIASINPIQRRLIRLHAYGDAVAAALDIGPFVPPATADRVKRGNGGWLSALSDLRWGETSGLAARRAFDGFRAFRRRFWGKYALPPSFLYDRYLIGA